MNSAQHEATAAHIRQSFLDFFAEKGHTVVPSSPVVIPSDPTLLFANAGMNQFKEYFLGARKSEHPRVADTQKCIRVSGKHNDLEEVGRDTYHHTFFEMLGNWSFGDYYKREAIAWAWEWLTDVWKLPKERLWATVYQDDDEALAIWKEVTDIDPARVLKFGNKDNFWEMGETGPCGPCSEIHIDLTEAGSGPGLVNAGTPEVIEIWNLVFIQYNRRSDGSLEELPARHVDTGMGLERVVAVLQGKKSNYDSDLFQPLIARIEALSSRRYEGEDAVAMRVIADHLRALSFAVADGVIPGNDGRGYVLRRLLRRAVRYGRKLGFMQPFMGELFPVLENMMRGVFPEISAQRETILRVLAAEEGSFAQTLDRGIELFDQVVADLRARGETVFPGAEAFKLYDTFGFPVDLTALMAEEQGLSVDRAAFEACMQEQRTRARTARKGGEANAEMDQLAELIQEGLSSSFTGYETLCDEAEVLVLYVDGQSCGEVQAGQQASVLLSKTPCYGEAGGQVGDTGRIEGPQGTALITDTRKPANGVLLHQVNVESGSLRKGDAVKVCVDAGRRAAIQRHHTATHLLNAALRKIIGASVRQAGSHVAPERLRFDFTHFEAVGADRLAQIEREVNAAIMRNEAVRSYEMPLKDVQGSDIVAVFDEKYGEQVRVLDIDGLSKELCGGTHVARTGDIGLCRIVSESSVAAGIRRIEAVCGEAALEWSQREHELLASLSHQFSCSLDELSARIAGLIENNKRIEKALKEEAARHALSGLDALLQQAGEAAGIPVLAAVAGEMAPDHLREVMDALRQRRPEGVIVLGATNQGKACFMATVPDDLVKRGLHAGKLVGEVARRAGGGGGGQPGKAQAGGKQADQVPAAIEAVPALIIAALGGAPA